MSKESNKTEQVINSLKGYINGLSKREKQKIEQELENEKDEEEEKRFIVTNNGNEPITFNTVVRNSSIWVYMYPQDVNVDWHINPAPPKPEEEAIEVDFS